MMNKPEKLTLPDVHSREETANDQRARYVADAVNTYKETHNDEDINTLLIDMIGDLLHFADRNAAETTQHIIQCAVANYNAELDGED